IEIRRHIGNEIDSGCDDVTQLARARHGIEPCRTLYVVERKKQRCAFGYGAVARDRPRRVQHAGQKPHGAALSHSTLCPSLIKEWLCSRRERESPLPPCCPPLAIALTKGQRGGGKDPGVAKAGIAVLCPCHDCQEGQPQSYHQPYRNAPPLLC